MSGEIHVGVDSCSKGWFYTVITDSEECETGIAPDMGWLWNRFNNAALIPLNYKTGFPHR